MKVEPKALIGVTFGEEVTCTDALGTVVSVDSVEPNVTVTIDRSLTGHAAQVPPMGGTPRPVGAISLPRGGPVTFVENELIVDVTPRLRLARLLADYDATVIAGDANVGLNPPARRGSAAREARRWLLIRTGRPATLKEPAPGRLQSR